MVNFRRTKIPGGMYFFTLTLRDRQSNFLIKHINLLRCTMKKVHANHPYKTIAIVILPDHLHAIWQLPEDDSNYSMRWRQIKRLFTESIISTGTIVKKNHRNEYDLWQRRFWEHSIRDEKDLETHVNYIHYNPVKHGYVSKTSDWLYSSFHAYVRNGLLPRDWGYQGNSVVNIGK